MQGRHGAARGDWAAEELAGEGADAVQLVLEPRVLYAEVLFLQRHLPEHGPNSKLTPLPELQELGGLSANLDVPNQAHARLTCALTPPRWQKP